MKNKIRDVFNKMPEYDKCLDIRAVKSESRKGGKKQKKATLVVCAKPNSLLVKEVL